MVIAHRGYSKFAKENTTLAFDKAILAGARGIECDIRMTSDNNAIISHNNFITIGDKEIKISKNTISYLKDVCKHSGHDLLTLDDFFEYLKHKQAQFFLELKSTSP